MLILARKSNRKAEDAQKSRLTITKDGELVGTVHVLYANGGLARLGLDFPPEFKIVRDDACKMGDSGKEDAA